MYKSLKDQTIRYTLLSDSTARASQAFGLAYRLSDDLVEKYKEYGIDIEKASGEKHHILPVPAVYVFDREGKVIFQYVNPDYKVRANPELILKAAEGPIK